LVRAWRRCLPQTYPAQVRSCGPEAARIEMLPARIDEGLSVIGSHPQATSRNRS
jgi:hypothetical protein